MSLVVMILMFAIPVTLMSIAFLGAYTALRDDEKDHYLE